ncbi:MAG: sigma-70 family RNA polymerase sigma factor [Gemmataceae bacterium]|nr:sigma-70 family RNA polymerase sigma factor [Gemmataceae bacterium]
MDSADSPNVPDLLERARRHQPGELDRLFGLCRNYLGILARAQVETWLQAKVDASDLIQQTMLEAYRDFHNFRGSTEAEWLAWLKRILAHNAANFVRQYRGTAKRQARREVGLIGPDDSAPGAADPADHGESPSECLLRKERELLVADALARLAPDHREVIILRNLQRLPFQDVAERMKRSRPAVQMLWMRALQKLQEALAEHGDDFSALLAPGKGADGSEV